MKQYRFLCAALLVFTSSFAFSLSLEDLAGTKNAELLRTDASIKSLQINNLELTLTPRSSGGERLKAEIVGFKPNVIVEAMYIYKKPAALSGKSWTEKEQLALYNMLRSLGTLTGIEYFSASRNTMRIFYESSVIVDGPDSKTRLPDPVVTMLNQKSTLYAVQKDLTFGENRYRYDYSASAQDLAFTQTNLTHMSYGIIPLIGKGALRTTVLVSDTDEAYVLYAVSSAKAMLIPGIETKIKNSFSNRADAIYRWFSQRADTVLSGL